MVLIAEAQQLKEGQADAQGQVPAREDGPQEDAGRQRHAREAARAPEGRRPRRCRRIQGVLRRDRQGGGGLRPAQKRANSTADEHKRYIRTIDGWLVRKGFGSFVEAEVDKHCQLVAVHARRTASGEIKVMKPQMIIGYLLEMAASSFNVPGPPCTTSCTSGTRFVSAR